MLSLTESCHGDAGILTGISVGGALTIEELRQMESDEWREQVRAVLDELDTIGHCDSATIRCMRIVECPSTKRSRE